MNKFLTTMLKASFLILVLLGVLVLSLGVVLFLYPNVLSQLLRCGSILTLVVGGAVLIVGALYGYVMARRSVL